MSKEPRVLIFDMDGVIIDSEPLHLKAYQTVLAGHGITYTEADNQQFLGRKDNDCAAALVERFTLPMSAVDFLQQKEEITCDLIRQEGRMQPGVMEVLETATDLGIPCGIASSATLSTIGVVVDALQIGRYFQPITSGEEVAHGKPAPDVFLKAASRLSASPRDCLVIEDTINGIKAARAATMQCVSVPCETTRYQDHSEADIRLESLHQLDLPNWFQTGRLQKMSPPREAIALLGNLICIAGWVRKRIAGYKNLEALQKVFIGKVPI